MIISWSNTVISWLVLTEVPTRWCVNGRCIQSVTVENNGAATAQAFLEKPSENVIPQIMSLWLFIVCKTSCQAASPVVVSSSLLFLYLLKSSRGRVAAAASFIWQTFPTTSPSRWGIVFLLCLFTACGHNLSQLWLLWALIRTYSLSWDAFVTHKHTPLPCCQKPLCGEHLCFLTASLFLLVPLSQEQAASVCICQILLVGGMLL